MKKQTAITIEKDSGVGILNFYLSDGWKVIDKTVLDDKVIYILEFNKGDFE